MKPITSTAGHRPEFLNAHTGLMQRAEMNDYDLKGSVSMSVGNDIESNYTRIIRLLPEVIDLSTKKDLIQYEHEEEYMRAGIDRNDLYNLSYGTLLKIYESTL